MGEASQQLGTVMVLQERVAKGVAAGVEEVGRVATGVGQLQNGMNQSLELQVRAGDMAGDMLGETTC